MPMLTHPCFCPPSSPLLPPTFAPASLPLLQIESSRARALADEYGMKFFEVSAKEGTSVAEAFNSLAKDVVAKIVAAGPEAVAAAKGGGGGGGAGGAGAKGGADGKDKKDCVIM